MIVSNMTIPYILDKRELSRTKYCFRDSFLYVWIVKFELVVLLVVTVRTRTDRERERENKKKKKKKRREKERKTGYNTNKMEKRMVCCFI